MRERFDEMRKMGIRTVMITGDNPLTAKAIADEAGVDDFLAEATPEDKMALIKQEQEGGKLVAMTGDGTNDAPALAQADVGVAMNTGTSAAKEAGNMVDLDSNPTKLIEIVEIGKQLLITRGALTTFSIANDVAKYFAIIPAMFAAVYPGPGQAQHHAPAQPGVGDHLGDHLQRADHRRADPAGAARRALPAGLGAVDAAQEPADLRRRRADHPVHRHQGHRPHRPVHPRIRRVTDMNRLPVIVRQHIAAFRVLLVFTVLCGLIYPLVMVGVAQLAFHNQANGSLVSYNGRVVGSSLLCQEFADAKGNPLPQYFQPRPSDAVDAAAKTDYGCDPLFSAASNLGPNNPDLVQLIKQRQKADRGVRPRPGVADPAGRGDRVGFGPGPGHLAAERGHPGQPRGGGQAPAGVRRSRRWWPSTPRAGCSASSASRAVNVLELNIALDQLSAKSGG